MKETDAINLSEIPEDTHNENRAKLAKKYSKIKAK